MKQILSRSWLITFMTIALLCFVTSAPLALRAGQIPRVADFAAPLSAQEAQERVTRAQHKQAELRAERTRTLAVTAPENLPMAETVYVDQSRYHLSDRVGFLSFWRRNGELLTFGYPISEELMEDGRIVQYFERARFEYHPEALGTPEQVQLSLLGRELTEGREFTPGAPELGEVYFPETGHTLSRKFRQFWEKRGGLTTFGYPISEPFDEVSTIDGQTRTVQYFERARFEYHPEQLDAFYQEQAEWRGLRLIGLYEVQLGDLGRQAAERRGYGFAGSRRLSAVPDWTHDMFGRRIDVDLNAQQLTAFEGDIPVFRAPIATGKDGFNTPSGSYAVYSKTPMETMTGSAGGETWYVPNIPWVQYVVGGVALHGTYWHDQWGTGVRMSHGCINLNIDDAQWLYEWADIGTAVDVHY